MAEIKITIYTQGGEVHDIEAPADIRASDLVKDLAEQLHFPAWDAEGNPVSWRLDNKDTGRTVDLERSLEQNGVQGGHRLSLMRQVTAGCFVESSQVLLPDGTGGAIGDLRSGDKILAYHADTASYRSEKIIGIYRQTYSSSVQINHIVETSLDQHFLLSSRRWVLASDLKQGDSLVCFPFGAKPVTSIARRDGLKSLISLTLAPSLCLVVEGFVARDLIGKQEYISRTIDIFLSYSVSDKDQARRLFERLDRSGRTIFLSEKSISPGDRWADSILGSLKSCEEFWLLVTPSSLRSEWVTTEWAAAWALEKKIVPVLFRCKPEDLPERLRAYQCVDFHEVGEKLQLS